MKQRSGPRDRPKGHGIHRLRRSRKQR